MKQHVAHTHTKQRPGGRVTNVVGTIFREIFVGTRAYALSNNVECVTSFRTYDRPTVSNTAARTTGNGTVRRLR